MVAMRHPKKPTEPNDAPPAANGVLTSMGTQSLAAGVIVGVRLTTCFSVSMHYDSTNDHRNGFGNADLERANRVGAPNIAVIFPIALIVFAPLPTDGISHNCPEKTGSCPIRARVDEHRSNA